MRDTATGFAMHEADKQLAYIKSILFNIRRACTEIREDVTMLECMIQSVETLAGESPANNKD